MPAGLSIGGYNLCYLRPEATLATVTQDEYKAPVAASWRAGAGRVVCYTGEADGKYAGDIARWDTVGDYFTSLARWAAGPSGNLGESMLLTQELREGVNVVQLHLDPERKGESFTNLPSAVTLRSLPGEPPRSDRATLQWTGADTLAVEVPLDGTETTLTTVEVPGYGPLALPPVCLPYSPEFKPDHNERGLQSLEKLEPLHRRQGTAGGGRHLARHAAAGAHDADGALAVAGGPGTAVVGGPGATHGIAASAALAGLALGDREEGETRSGPP